MDYRLCWHPALERDAANLWLRGLVKDSVADYSEGSVQPKHARAIRPPHS